MSLNPTGPEWANANVSSATTIGLSNGTILTLWVVSYPDGGGGIRGSISNPDGSGSTGTFHIKSAATGMLFLPSATALSNGRFAVAWSHNTDGIGDFRLETQIFNNDGTEESAIALIGSNLASDARLVTLADGGYAVTYRDGGFKSVTLSPTGAAGEPITLPPGSSQSVAALAGGGYVTVVAKSAEDFNSSAIYAYLRDSNGQVTEKAITGFGNRGEMQVAGLADDNFVVVWLDHSGTGNVLKAQLVNAQGDIIGGELTLYQNTAGAREELTVKALPEGGFTVAFVQRETETDVYVGAYSASGDVITPPSAIGRTIAGSQSSPSIMVLNDGRYVVSWSDAGDNSIHFQAYDPRTKGVTVSGDDANDRFTGTGFGDVLSGGGGNDQLLGEGGNDVLNGGLGGDLMFGGAGNDIYYVDSSDDRIVEWENAGVDHVITTVSQDLWDDVENLTALGTGAVTLNGNELSNKITGNAGRNTLKGQAGNDILNGGIGIDTLIGGAGNDIFYVDNASDVVTETARGGRDTVYTSVSLTLASTQEIEVLTATGRSNIKLKGNSIANAITGNTGANKIYGGLGNDKLKGGAGKDYFVFNTKANTTTNKDTIVDFSTRDDTIWLDNAVFTKLGRAGTETRPAMLNKNFFVLGTKAKDLNDFVIYDKAKGVLYYDADGSGKGAAVVVATFTTKSALTLADFFVV